MHCLACRPRALRPALPCCPALLPCCPALLCVESSSLLRGRAVPDPSISLAPPKKVKDPNAPKPPWNGYMFLTQELKPGMQAADPSLTLMDIGRVIGAKWRGMTPEEKQPYLDQSSADSIR